jgi:hypothetical protein
MRISLNPLEVNALGNSDCICNGFDCVSSRQQIANLLLQFGVEETFSAAFL